MIIMNEVIIKEKVNQSIAYNYNKNLVNLKNIMQENKFK